MTASKLLRPGSPITTMGDLFWVICHCDRIYVGSRSIGVKAFENKSFGRVMALLIEGRLRTAIHKDNTPTKKKHDRTKPQHRTATPTRGRSFGR